MKTIYLAGGCFWCTEAVFQRIKGVLKVVPGYIDGSTKNPSYREVCSGKTGHTEAISVLYNNDIIKLTDLSSVFELFIFSDILELNREILKEGNSLILTINKNIIDENNRFKRINVKKIASLKNLFNKPISNIEIFINDQKSIDKIEKILSKNGNTEVKIKIKDEKNKYIINLKNKRFVDRKSLNLLKNQGISTNIL